ncbi:MAG: dipeptidase [Gemmatimonadaceae bacterium]
MMHRLTALAGLVACIATARADAQAASADKFVAQARRLLQQAPLIDTHNDLPMMLRLGSQNDLEQFDPDGPLPSLDTEIPRLKAGGVGAQFWAAYVPSRYDGKGAGRYAFEQIDVIHRMIERSPVLELATTADDIVHMHRGGKIASLIGIEGGHAIENSLGMLRQFHAVGVRYMTLTHSSTIAWADASTDSAEHGGRTRFGVEVVREMNRLGMMVDISHVSDDAMRDVAQYSAAPLFFSHSSARAIADHPRNVPDDIVALVRAKGGVVMVNAYPPFVDPRAAQLMRNASQVERQLRARFPTQPAKADSAFAAYINGPDIPHGTLAGYMDHIDHIVKVAGIDHVGIGADLGSLKIHPAGFEDATRYPWVVAELLRRRYSEQDVIKMIGGNVLRVMRETEGVARRLHKTRLPSAATIGGLDSTGTAR